MQWGKTDDAANSVSYAVNQFGKTANSTNKTAFFGNTTADAFVTGIAVGQFGVTPNEQQAERASGTARPAHAGWVVRTEGTGGRAGRVSYETMVAMRSMSNDAEDDVFEDYTITIITQPAAVSANATANETATFSVSATSTPATTLSYQWQANTGSGFSNISGATSSSVVVNANTATNQARYRVIVSATGADSVTSSSALLTRTT